MRIAQLFRPHRPLFSIELYPPKTPDGVSNLKHKLVEIAAHDPDYISVTYGAAGGTRHTTREICAFIKRELGIEAMAHLTCVAHSRGEIHELLSGLRSDGIENIMALRGDPPQGQERFVPPEDGFAYAAELVQAIRAERSFGIGVAGYPEGHVEAPSYEVSLQHQIAKIRAGADFVVSQLFLDNALFLRWRDDLRRAGIAVPIVPGILPALSAPQITRFAALCGAKVPAALRVGLERFEAHPESAASFGLVYAMRQIEALLREGVDGIHLYALNRLESIRTVSALVHDYRRPA
jgi:methylenetetrahydrofolate reductase (NADPH)